MKYTGYPKSEYARRNSSAARTTNKSSNVKTTSQVLQKLESEINANKIAPTYLVFSSDNVIVDEIINLLKESLLTPGFESFDFDYLHCEEAGLNTVLSKVFTPPAASTKRLVVIKDVLNLKKGDRVELITKLAKPRDFSVAVVATEWDGGLQDLAKRTPETIIICSFYKPFLRDLKEQVRGWALQKGMTIDSDAIDLLIDIAGESQDVLNEELEKIRILIGSGKRITRETVRKTAAKARDYELKELTAAIAEQNLKKSLRILLRLNGWGEEPVKIIGWTGNEMFRILRVRELKRNPMLVAKEFNLTERSLRLKDLIRWAQGWTSKQLNTCLVELAMMDKAIKRGYPEPYFLLESFLIRNLEHEIDSN
jgi:DNA polymerase III delta subunit